MEQKTEGEKMTGRYKFQKTGIINNMLNGYLLLTREQGKAFATPPIHVGYQRKESQSPFCILPF